MSVAISEQKAAIRRKLRAWLRTVSPNERETASGRVIQRISLWNVWRDARTVLLYIPLADELNLLPLLDSALHHHKTVLLPRFNEAAGTYEPAVIANLTTDLKSGPYGVSEPRKECPVYPVNRLDVTLVPGLGFDGGGRRLGRGKGFYDRLLVNATGWLCGVGMDGQRVEALPAEPHDVVLNCIATPSEWVDVSPPRG